MYANQALYDGTVVPEHDAETAFWRQTFWRPEISIEENLFTFCGGVCRRA